MKNDKRGISAIVATVLIILITVAAVTIIWAAIIPMIKDNIEGSTECYSATATLSVKESFSCYNETNKSVKLQVERQTGDFELLGMDIIASYQGNSKTVKITNITQLPAENNLKVYILGYNNGAGEHGNFSDLPGIDEAGVAAIVKTGNTQKTCPTGSYTKIPACA